MAATNIHATEKAIQATLDGLGFAATNPHNDCRDHAASADAGIGPSISSRDKNDDQLGFMARPPSDCQWYS